MPDYQKGKIYKIVDLDTDECYIGSTCEPTLAKRLAKHVVDYKCWLNGTKNYITSFKIIENNNYDILLLENFPCDSKDQLHARESYYCQTMVCVNKLKNQGLISALGGCKEYQKDYYKENKENILAKTKQYRSQHKDSIQKFQKEYRQKNKKDLLAKSKQYNEQHKESIIEYQSEYRAQHKEKAAEKHICECGGSYSLHHKSTHFKTAKHIKHFADQQNV